MLVAIALWAFYSWLLARPPASMRPPQRPGWDWAGLLLAQTLFGRVAGSAAGAEALLTGAQIHGAAGSGRRSRSSRSARR